MIGFGTGITAGALSQYPGLTTRVCAELLPAVVRASAQFQGNYGAGSDPQLDIRLRDGRRELLASTQTYDMITLEPPPPSAAGVVNLYSRDFYRLAGGVATLGGMLTQLRKDDPQLLFICAGVWVRFGFMVGYHWLAQVGRMLGQPR